METQDPDDLTGAAFNPNAVRCKAKAKTTGKRCRNPARVGFAVCSTHGAGYRQRPGGRPPRHSLDIRRDEVLVRAVERRYGRGAMDAYEALTLAQAALELATERLDERVSAGEATMADYRELLRLSDVVSRQAARLR